VVRKRNMLSPTSGRVKAIRTAVVLLTCVVAASGCFWRSYPKRMRTHVEVLVGIARKASDLVAARRFTAENLPELTYPLERATAFAAEVRGRTSTPPESLDAFETLLARYRALITEADQGRLRAQPAGDVPLASQLADVEAAARVVEAALDRERG
jgi:hypothetical protein